MLETKDNDPSEPARNIAITGIMVIKIAKNNLEKDKIVIGVASFTDLYLSRKMLPDNLKNKIIISGQDYQNADYILNNNIFEINPKFNDKYSIPKAFEKYLSLKRGNILINEFYKKRW